MKKLMDIIRWFGVKRDESGRKFIYESMSKFILWYISVVVCCFLFIFYVFVSSVIEFILRGIYGVRVFFASGLIIEVFDDLSLALISPFISRKKK